MDSKSKSSLELMAEEQYGDSVWFESTMNRVREVEEERDRELGLYHPEHFEQDKTNGYSL